MYCLSILFCVIVIACIILLFWLYYCIGQYCCIGCVIVLVSIIVFSGSVQSPKAVPCISSPVRATIARHTVSHSQQYIRN